MGVEGAASGALGEGGCVGLRMPLCHQVGLMGLQLILKASQSSNCLVQFVTRWFVTRW